MTRPLLFCNVGWMREYQGQTPDDKIIGGGHYVRVQKNGGEVCNFIAHRGKMFGYVQPTRDQIKLERIGADKDADWFDDVDVVVTARAPGKDQGTVIVGWYRNARVHRFMQHISSPPNLRRANKATIFRFEAVAGNVVLIPPDDRWFEIPRGKGGMGQSNVWYADKVGEAWKNKVRAYIDSPRKKEAPQKGKRSSDPAKNAKVEEAAMKHVREHYENQDFVVSDVSDGNFGWDLEARKGARLLRIEVKGLTAPNGQVGLTPNEYIGYNEYPASYRLCIVTSALSSPTLTICALNPANNRLMIEPGGAFTVASLKERIAAIILLE